MSHGKCFICHEEIAALIHTQEIDGKGLAHDLCVWPWKARQDKERKAAPEKCALCGDEIDMVHQSTRMTEHGRAHIGCVVDAMYPGGKRGQKRKIDVPTREELITLYETRPREIYNVGHFYDGKSVTELAKQFRLALTDAADSGAHGAKVKFSPEIVKIEGFDDFRQAVKDTKIWFSEMVMTATGETIWQIMWKPALEPYVRA